MWYEQPKFRLKLIWTDGIRQETITYGQESGQLGCTTSSALDRYWCTNEEILESVLAFYVSKREHKQGSKPIL